MMNRRSALRLLSGTLTAAAWPAALQAGDIHEPGRSKLGLVIYCCNLRRRWLQQQNPEFDLFAPLNFLQHCRSLGAGGMQCPLGILEPQQAVAVKDFAEQHQLFIEASVRPPSDDHDVARFDAEIRTAAAVGANIARTVVMPGRRYEQFSTLAEFQAAAVHAEQMLQRAVPIVEKHRVRLAVENHKDQRLDERLGLLERISSEFVGACVDTGNSVALLDDAYETVTALAPWAVCVHLKDQALRQYHEGFLLGDIPLGQGAFDLPRMVRILRDAKPDIQFALELITRDPLQVPCLTQKYWATMPDVSARQLVRGFQIVRQHPAKELQQVSRLTLEQQVALEDDNVTTSLHYAQQQLNL